MEGSFPTNLRLWGGPAPIVHEPAASGTGSPFSGPHNPAEFARRLYALESLAPASLPHQSEEEAEPFTLQWFLNIESQRHGRRGRWIPRLLEFSKHPGETLLGLGHGLGTDWLQYARHGACVVVCSPFAEQLSLIRRNFELRGLNGRFMHAMPTCLPLPSASIDVTCVSTLVQDRYEPQAVVDEVYRVLKPGGKVLAVTPARRNVDYWFNLCYPWYRWLQRDRKTANEMPLQFTGKSLRRLFQRFEVHRVQQRHLRSSDVPHVWRWVPLPLLERWMGSVLVLKAFKPLSAAIPSQAVA